MWWDLCSATVELEADGGQMVRSYLINKPWSPFTLTVTAPTVIISETNHYYQMLLTFLSFESQCGPTVFMVYLYLYEC